MTKDKVRKKNFKWRSQRQKSMVMSCIRELINTDMNVSQIVAHIFKEFKVDAHVRTVEGWIKNQSCRYHDSWVKEQATMNRWHEELKAHTEPLSDAETLLNEMFSTARSRGLLQ